MISLLAFIVTLGVLITVHEFGHFWVARRLGVKVLRFSIGFGKPLWQRRGRDGTEYVIAALPLGGYVKMLDEREGEVPAAELPLAFNRQPVGSRIAIVLAGPLGNFLFAILAYSLNRVLSEMRLALNALSTSIESVVQSGDIYVFRGLEERIATANRLSGSWVRAGIYCLVGSAVLTAISIFRT